MIAKTFSSDGALGKAIPGFQARQPQIDMAEAVSSAIKDQTQLVVEAGTGTGKTFAYLVPALLSGKKVIISTGSKNLQEQLYHRDLPLMVNALGFYGQVALLKGRSNYLCLDRLSRQMVESHTNESDPTLLTQLVKVRAWSSETKTGDLGDCDDLPEDSMIIPTITSTNDNCLGKECPSYTDCFVLKARKRAMDSDIVVVNHHLFLADLAIKETGFGELIPEADVFIFDEAHLRDKPAVNIVARFRSEQVEVGHNDLAFSFEPDDLIALESRNLAADRFKCEPEVVCHCFTRKRQLNDDFTRDRHHANRAFTSRNNCQQTGNLFTGGLASQNKHPLARSVEFVQCHIKQSFGQIMRGQHHLFERLSPETTKRNFAHCCDIIGRRGSSRAAYKIRRQKQTDHLGAPVFKRLANCRNALNYRRDKVHFVSGKGNGLTSLVGSIILDLIKPLEFLSLATRAHRTVANWAIATFQVRHGFDHRISNSGSRVSCCHSNSFYRRICNGLS